MYELIGKMGKMGKRGHIWARRFTLPAMREIVELGNLGDLVKVGQSTGGKRGLGHVDSVEGWVKSMKKLLKQSI